MSPRTGVVLKTFDVDSWGFPDRKRPGVFWLGKWIVSAETLTAVERPDRAVSPTFEIDPKCACVVACIDSSERTLWRANLPPRLAGDPTYEATDAGSVVLAGSANDLVALARSDGHEIWHSPGAGLGVCVDGDVVVAHDGGDGLVGRSLATGSELFECDEPSKVARILAIDGDFLVFVGSWTRVHDRRGAVLLDIPCRGADVEPTSGGFLVASTEGIELDDRSGRLVWRNVGLKPYSDEWGRFVYVENGDVIAMAGASRALNLARIGATTGKTLWSARCEPAEGDLRTGYSHEVYAEVRGDHLVVVNQGVASYLEVLDIATGKQRRRFNYPPK